MTQAYPLAWPDHRPRTPTWKREHSRFKTTFAIARDNLLREIRLLGGRNVVMSTNVALRNDGLPYANQRKLDDPGVAIYFEYRGKSFCFACDRWADVAENMQAVCKTIDALRGVARWGTGDMMEAAFTGFVALPAPSQTKIWREVLGVSPVMRDLELVRAAYRKKASENHPDRGGSDTTMAEINAAWEAAQKELGRG